MFSYVTSMYSKLDTYNLVEDGAILAFIPFLNHLILPCVPSASMKRRIGVGVFFLLLSSALATIVKWQLSNIHSHHMQLFWQMMPIILFAVAETLIFVSGEMLCMYSFFSSIPYSHLAIPPSLLPRPPPSFFLPSLPPSLTLPLTNYRPGVHIRAVPRQHERAPNWTLLLHLRRLQRRR